MAKAVLLAVALATADFALSACWAVCLDVGARHAGVITGFMNTSGNLGGLIGPLVVGVMVERWQSWTYPFYVTAAVYVMGAAGLAGDRPGASGLRDARLMEVVDQGVLCWLTVRCCAASAQTNK